MEINKKIKKALEYLLLNLLNLEVKSISFFKLPKGSFADKQAYLMRKDSKNEIFKNKLKLNLSDIEKFLK